MSIAESISLVRRYIDEVWNQANTPAIDQLVAETYRYWLGGQPPRDKAAMKQFVLAVHAAFPDWKAEIEDIVADGSIVAVRWKGKVTHEGAFHSIPATGKQLSVCGINMYKLDDNVITQEWEQMDSLGMLQQLGVLPSDRQRTE